MDTCGADGSAHTSRLVRVCFPYESIVYKQTMLPELMSAHVGRWRVYPVAAGVRVTAHQTVMIRPDKLGQLVGPNGTFERAGELIRRALGKNTLLTMAHAKHAVEGRRRNGHSPAAPTPSTTPTPPTPSATPGGLTPAIVVD
jgi:aromatase